MDKKNSKMEIFTKDHMKMVVQMDQENMNGQMAVITKDTLLMAIEKVKVSLSSLTVASIQVYKIVSQ